MTIGEIVLRQGIANDAAYAGHLASDLANSKHASFAPIVSLCMVPYLSLFVHESHRKLERVEPTLASMLSSDVQSIVASSRHSLKLFEDNHRGITGQIAYFRDEILPAHTRRFLGNTWLPLARPFEKDLGLFIYNQKLVASTHGANFFLGIEPNALLAKSGAEMRSIYEQYGRYFGQLGAQLNSNGQPFVGHLDPRSFNQWPKDVRAAKYYSQVFDGPSSPDLNAVLTVFRGMMNLASLVTTPGAATVNFDYTVFKIRFLTLYQILGSLKLLRDEQLHSITRRSVSFIDKMVGTTEAQLITTPTAKTFRNTLMHYALDSRIDVAQVDANQPLFGLVPVYFPSYDVAAFTSVVDHCINETASAMEEWANP